MNCLRPIHKQPWSQEAGSTKIYLPVNRRVDGAEMYWTTLTQQQAFADEIETLMHGQSLSKPSPLFSLHPFVDSSGLLHVGGRGRNTEMSYSITHPVILPGKHPITSLLISSEHQRLMHAGPTLLAASLSR